MLQPLQKVFWQFLKMLSTELYDPGVLFLAICPREIKIYVPTKICTQMLRATLANHQKSINNIKKKKKERKCVGWAEIQRLKS